jgi:hypothetical protein
LKFGEYMREFLSTTVSAVAIAVLLVPASFALQSNDAGARSVTTSSVGIVTYPTGYFENFTPVTALDMVQRVPGFSVSDGDTSRRGLGDSFGNVLINGARPSNKSLQLETVLQRIPFADVASIDLIQEAMPEYEMRGHARLVNVILTEGSGGSGSFDLQTLYFDSGRVGQSVDLSYTSSAGPVEFTFGLDANVHGNRVSRDWARFDANGDLFETQNDGDQRRQFWGTFTLSMNWVIDDSSSLRLDAQVNPWSWHRANLGTVYAPGPGGAAITRYGQNATQNHGRNRSLSGTYQRDLTDSLSMQTMVLIDRENGNDGPEPYETFDVVAGFLGSTIVEFHEANEESALRQTFSWTPHAGHQIEFGAEGAINARETDLSLFEDDGLIVTQIPLAVANTRVEETRTEVFANHVWSINETLSLESGIRYEMSEIIQTGDAEQTRSFSYAKPSVTLNWRLNEQDRLRISGRRDIDQLQFGRFASSVSVTDNQSTLGNPNYVPQQSWTVEGEWEHRFGDDGSFSFLLGHDWIQDLDGRLPVTTATGIFDTFGNIGDGRRLRAVATVSTALDAIGLGNAVIDADIGWTKTSVDDPLTGIERAFFGTSEWNLNLDYRQTFPAQQLAWGWDYHWRSDYEMFFASQYHLHDDEDGDLDIYVETTRWLGVTTRLGVNEALASGNDRYRVFYDGSRADNIVTGSEQRNAKTGPTWYVQLRGTF